MPFSRFWQRRERILKRQEAEQKEELTRWLVGIYAQSRSLYHALTANSDLPPTRAQAQGKEKPDWAKIEQARQSRIEHDEQWFKALRSPQHFGAFFGMGHILGEPPPDEVRPAKSMKEVERAAHEQFVAALEAQVARMR